MGAVIDGRGILKQGIIRLIGNGSTADVWETNWLPMVGPMHPITSLTPNTPRMVSELIDATTASWRKDLIRLVFLPFDADAIMAIPLCTRNVEDFWSWSSERSGNFTVKSAYSMILNTKEHRGS